MRGSVWPVVAIVLAGCFGGGDGAPTAVNGATATSGILQGVVVDDAIRPLAGAAVNVTSLAGQRLNATTGDDGLFRFVDLPPGTYVVEAGKRHYTGQQVAAVVEAAVDDPPRVRLLLTFEAATVPFAQTYKHEGFHECGFNVVRVCSNVNIVTWIVVCGQTGGAVCPGNVTSDRSVFFQDIDGLPDFIQAELAWEATLPLGDELGFLIGGGTEAELRAGVGLPAYNYSSGPSPLMVRVSNHEGPGAWCRNVPDPPCEERALEGSKIGTERALLGQVDAGPTAKGPACLPGTPASQPTCGAGQSTMQKFALFTTVFYGYEPPTDWRFSDGTGLPPAP